MYYLLYCTAKYQCLFLLGVMQDLYLRPVWPDWQFLKHLIHKFSSIRSPNIWWLLEQFWKMASFTFKLQGIFWATNRQNWLLLISTSGHTVYDSKYVLVECCRSVCTTSQVASVTIPWRQFALVRAKVSTLATWFHLHPTGLVSRSGISRPRRLWQPWLARTIMWYLTIQWILYLWLLFNELTCHYTRNRKNQI